MENTHAYQTHGLNTNEVQERKDAGKQNGISQPASKTYYQILKDNIFTLFNLLNFFINDG